MKDTKQCPNCMSSEIYTADSMLGQHTTILLPEISSFFSYPQIEVYVGGKCGLHQTFVKRETLDKVKQKYKLYR